MPTVHELQEEMVPTVVPTESELVDEIAAAMRAAVDLLLSTHPTERFYYIALITTGEAVAPALTAWSWQALERAVHETPSSRDLLKWSWADSPYWNFGEQYFRGVQRLFRSRPSLNSDNWAEEYETRLRSMEAAVARLDREGIFGRGSARLQVVVNVETMPPDTTNTARARRLNPAAALEDFLAEAAEPD